MTIELSDLTFTEQDDIVPQSGVEEILNTDIANTLAGNDKIIGTSEAYGFNDYGFKNVGVLNTDDGNDTITGHGTDTGIIIGYLHTLDTGNGDDVFTGTGTIYGFENSGTFNTSDGNDII